MEKWKKNNLPQKAKKFFIKTNLSIFKFVLFEFHKEFLN